MSKFEDAVNEIQQAVGESVSRRDIENALRQFVQMGVPLNTAKVSVIRKFGGTATAVGESKKVAEIMPGDSRLNLRVKVLSINPKDYESDGMTRTMYYGTIGDESGVIPFTAWQLDTVLRKGDCVEIKNAYTNEWQGRTKVVIGQNTKIKLLPPDSVKVKNRVRQVKVVDMEPGMGFVEIVAKILNVSRRDVNVGGEQKTVYSGILADDTGEIPFSAWGVEVNKDSVLRISGGYVSTFRGMPQFVFDSKAEIEPMDVKIEVKEVPVSIETIEGRGGYNVLLEGVVIEIKDGSGLIYRCPECRRVIEGTNCPVHGRVTPLPDLRIKAVVDDGTGAVMCMFNREQTEQILGMSTDEAVKLVQENMGITSVIEEALEDKLVARPIRVRGNVSSDDKYGLRMFVNDFEIPKIEEIAKNAQKILDELGW